MADDLQDILMGELMSLKPVSEANVDDLLQEVERIRELYAKAGDGGMAERWIVAAIRKNLPDSIIKYLSIEFRQATNIEQIQSIVATHLHDYRTGLPRDKVVSLKMAV